MFIEYQNRSRNVKRRVRVCVCVCRMVDKKKKKYKEAEKCLSFLSHSYSFSAFIFSSFCLLSNGKILSLVCCWRTGFWWFFLTAVGIYCVWWCMAEQQCCVHVCLCVCLCRQGKSTYRINCIEWTMEELLWDQLYICTTYEWTMLSLEGVKKFTLLEMFISRRPFGNWNIHARTHPHTQRISIAKYIMYFSSVPISIIL